MKLQEIYGSAKNDYERNVAAQRAVSTHKPLTIELQVGEALTDLPQVLLQYATIRLPDGTIYKRR